MQLADDWRSPLIGGTVAHVERILEVGRSTRTTRSVRGGDHHSGIRLDPDKVIADGFDAGQVLGRHLQRGALTLVPDRTVKFENSVSYHHIDSLARTPGLLVD